MGKYQRPPYCGILKEAGREEDLRIAGEDRLSKKQRYINRRIRKTQLQYYIKIHYCGWLHVSASKKPSSAIRL
jgi:hypothetical protein